MSLDILQLQRNKISMLEMIAASVYTAQNATDLLQVVNFIELLQTINMLQQCVSTVMHCAVKINTAAILVAEKFKFSF